MPHRAASGATKTKDGRSLGTAPDDLTGRSVLRRPPGGVRPGLADPWGGLLACELRQDVDRVLAGSAWQDSGLVFTRADGSSWPPEIVSQRFRELAAAAGLRGVRLHDLRHGQASLMLAAGVPMSSVSKRLGHASIAITADTYSHLLEGVGRAAAQAAADLVPRATPAGS